MSAKSDAMYRMVESLGTGFINKALSESNQELNIALGLLQNEQNMNQQYKQSLLEKGLVLPGGGSDGFKGFVDTAGDSSVYDSLGQLYAQAKLDNDYYVQAFNDYNTGQMLGDSLRSQGAASTGRTVDGVQIPDEEFTTASYMFNPEELDSLTSGDNPALTVDQRNNPNFMKGLNLTQNEAMKIITIDQQIATNRINLQNLEFVQDETELKAIQVHKNETIALVSSIITDRLQLAGINVSYFSDLGMGENASIKIDQFEEKIQEIGKLYPHLGEEIVRAMNIYAAPETLAHTKHHGFIQMGIDQLDNKKRMIAIEAAAYNDMGLRNKLRLELDEATKHLDAASIQRLVSYHENESNYEYSNLVGKYNDSRKLGLHLDDSSLERFQQVMAIEDGIEQKRMDIINNLLGAPEAVGLNYVSSEDWRAGQNQMIDDMFDRFAANDTTNNDSNNPEFDLSVPGLESGLESIITKQSEIISDKNSYDDAYKALNKHSILTGDIDVTTSLPREVNAMDIINPRNQNAPLELSVLTQSQVGELYKTVQLEIDRLYTEDYGIGEGANPEGDFFHGIFKHESRDHANLTHEDRVDRMNANRAKADQMIKDFDAFISAWESQTG